ncbi:MAG: isoprenoid biosynthesis glyoxalase ElbB [Candidatus Melainabacteria bacterium]|nr:isoprenoid biosynthesis glyoxalase ElbB [Candidatus Melainabacteria bacterium]MBI3308434.1 isoprenoid biosynthesis glyoxalase ElbB [Candidatus Melainabacteria bacterium]
MARVGVLLSGCGVMDGSEIHESVLALLAIDKAGLEAMCIAPNKEQTQVINHITNKPEKEKRNILIESARIARGNIKDLSQVNANDIDALVMPGGFGAACNLSSFATEGQNAKVLPEVEKFLKELHKQNKPIGAICIAPNILAKVFGDKNIKLTIGSDENTAKALEAMGAKHVNKKVNEIVVDEKNMLVTTPAYMLGKGPKEVEEGINLLIQELVKLMEKSTLSIS